MKSEYIMINGKRFRVATAKDFQTEVIPGKWENTLMISVTRKAQEFTSTPAVYADRRYRKAARVSGQA